MLTSLQATPPRYAETKLEPIDEYFAMGRGHQKDGIDVPSLVSDITPLRQALS